MSVYKVPIEGINRSVQTQIITPYSHVFCVGEVVQLFLPEGHRLYGLHQMVGQVMYTSLTSMRLNLDSSEMRISKNDYTKWDFDPYIKEWNPNENIRYLS